MRILHTCLRYPPAKGNKEQYIQELTSRTRNIREKRDVRVLTSSLASTAPVSLLDPNLLMHDPIYVQRLHHAKSPFIHYPRLQALSYYLQHHDPDIIHAYGAYTQPADTAGRFARKKRIPFIFHPFISKTSKRRGYIQNAHRALIGRKTFECADIVAVASPEEKDLLEQLGYAIKRIEMLPPLKENSSSLQTILSLYGELLSS